MTKLYHYTFNERHNQHTDTDIDNVWEQIQRSGTILPEMDTPIHNSHRDAYECNDSNLVWLTTEENVPGGCMAFGQSIFNLKGVGSVQKPDGTVLRADPYKYPDEFNEIATHAIDNGFSRFGGADRKLRRYTFDSDVIGAQTWNFYNKRYARISPKRKQYVASLDICSLMNGDDFATYWIVDGAVKLSDCIETTDMMYRLKESFLQDRGYAAGDWSSWVRDTIAKMYTYPHLKKYAPKRAA